MLIDGVELEYELRGAGEPIVLIHWGVGVVWAEPLLDEPALADGYRLLSYHRAGFAGSGRIEGSISMADHAVKASGARMEELQDLCSYVQDTSPVKDVLGNPVPVTTTIEVIGR